MNSNPSISVARAVADAVLYEGYLLYPYRASSQKNQSRWQFGILGPPGAAAAGLGEEPEMFAECLLQPRGHASVDVCARFLRLQRRVVERADSTGLTSTGFIPVDELTVSSTRWLSWDEATEHEVSFGPFPVEELMAARQLSIVIPAETQIEPLTDESGAGVGRLVRRSGELRGTLTLGVTELRQESETPSGAPLMRLRVAFENAGNGSFSDDAGAIAASFIGAHVLLSLAGADFVSIVDPPPKARMAAADCRQKRFWPVLAGPDGQQDILLLSPIILYDHPQIAPESSVALYDSTEIDEILTLRILTMTEAEKADARATDARAAAIIDRCEAMTIEQLQQLHGALRDPRSPVFGAEDADAVDFPVLFDDSQLVDDSQLLDSNGTAHWWDPDVDALVQPHADSVLVDGVPVARGSHVRINPKRSADAQDMFFAGQTGIVASVHFDVDGSTHIGVTLDVDPAAELHEWFGRYLYFAPEEIEPLHSAPDIEEGKLQP